MALRGADIDDMEFVEQFGLDPTLAYTPELNDAMLDVVMQQNIDGGMDEKKARSNRASAMAGIKALMK